VAEWEGTGAEAPVECGAWLRTWLGGACGHRSF
jgi:hypothetical protein